MTDAKKIAALDALLLALYSETPDKPVPLISKEVKRQIREVCTKHGLKAYYDTLEPAEGDEDAEEEEEEFDEEAPDDEP